MLYTKQYPREETLSEKEKMLLFQQFLQALFLRVIDTFVCMVQALETDCFPSFGLSQHYKKIIYIKLTGMQFPIKNN